ncbi:transposase [Azospirillum argentinense]
MRGDRRTLRQDAASGQPLAHRWWERGQRPAGLCDKRFTSAYLYAAVCPASGADFALVMPTVSTTAMSLFLDGFSRSLEPDVQAVLVLDQAGWHGAWRWLCHTTSHWRPCRPTALN